MTSTWFPVSLLVAARIAACLVVPHAYSPHGRTLCLVWEVSESLLHLDRVGNKGGGEARKRHLSSQVQMVRLTSFSIQDLGIVSKIHVESAWLKVM